MKAPEYVCKVDLAGKLRMLKSFNASYAAGLREQIAKAENIFESFILDN